MGTGFFGSMGRVATPSPTRQSPVRADSIDVQQISETQWRVCNRSWPEHDARNLLGFIERIEELFEVVQIDDGLKRFTFLSLTAATAHFSDPRERR